MEIKDRAFKYAVSIIKLVDVVPHNVACRIIIHQLLRSATSIGANITEAQASSSRREFTKYIGIALRSASESLFWLKLLIESQKLSHHICAEVLQETDELCKILGSSLLTLRNKR